MTAVWHSAGTLAVLIPRQGVSFWGDGSVGKGKYFIIVLGVEEVTNKKLACGVGWVQMCVNTLG